MRTLYRVEENVYRDCEGRYTDWEPRTDYTTYELAKEATKAVPERDGMHTGDWRIVARTIDEATFTVTDEVIEQFDWWKEVGRRQYYVRQVKYCETDLKKARKKRHAPNARWQSN